MKYLQEAKNTIILLSLLIKPTTAWNDHYDEEDDTWVLKVLLPILGAIVLFCIGGCFYQHHIRKEAEKNGESDRDVTGTDQLPSNMTNNKVNPFGENNYNNHQIQQNQNNNNTNNNINKPKINNINTPPTIGVSNNYQKVNPFIQRNQSVNNYQQNNTNNTNYQPTSIYSLPRSQSYAFGKGPQQQQQQQQNQQKLGQQQNQQNNYEIHKPNTNGINRSTSVMQPNGSNYFNRMNQQPNNTNFPKRGHSIHANYMNKPIASFNNQQNNNNNNNSEGIYIETGSSESNYSQVDGMNPNIHRQNLLPGNTSNVNRRAFRQGRYGGNRLS